MNRLLESADRYLEQSSWRDIAVLKVCLLSLGLLAGMELPEKWRRPARFIAAFLFAVTYLPLMMRFLPILINNKNKD